MTFFESTPAFIIAFILFLTMVLMTFCGHLLVKARARKNSEVGGESLEGGVLGLVALLLAFTFSMSASRFDDRRKIIVEEANAIGTAVLRADLYSDSIREEFRKDFKAYVELRINYYEVGADIPKALEALKKGNELSDKIWKRASTLGRDPKYFVSTAQMIPALNSMIDIVTLRLAASLAKVPPSIFYLLFLLCITASFFIGYGRKGKRFDWIVVIGFSLMTSLAIYLILDLDRPRRGLITMDGANERMIELRSMFKE